MQTQRRHVLGSLSALGLMAAGVGAGPAGAQPAEAQSREAKAPPLPAVGTRIRLPAVSLLDGAVFKGEQLQGRITVLYWWASTCPFCAQQSPEMQKLWQSQAGRGLQFLGLSVDKTAAEAQAYRAKRGYTWPSAWVSPAFEKAFPKPRGLPITLVIGREGQVLQAEKGQIFPEDVEQLARWL
jgi:hypothetical protein